MQLSIATDYAGGTGDPSPKLKNIANAGFKNIQWVHHMDGDFIYTQSEIDYVAKLLKKYKLSIYDIHSATGNEKNWFSLIEYQRQAGVDLVKNRVDMCKQLGGSVIVMHTPSPIKSMQPQWRQLKLSLDELKDYCLKKQVKIAIENCDLFDDFSGIKQLFNTYSDNFLGLCYDSGHGNHTEYSLENLDSVKDRLISLHLNDNNGLTDQHRFVFTGVLNCQKLASIIKSSPYNQSLTFELLMVNTNLKDENLFLKQAYNDGQKLLSMISSL
jgi:sugar phosphate isomerase/epimerase